jgi:hypothetical protein
LKTNRRGDIVRGGRFAEAAVGAAGILAILGRAIAVAMHEDVMKTVADFLVVFPHALVRSSKLYVCTFLFVNTLRRLLVPASVPFSFDQPQQRRISPSFATALSNSTKRPDNNGRRLYDPKHQFGRRGERCTADPLLTDLVLSCNALC